MIILFTPMTQKDRMIILLEPDCLMTEAIFQHIVENFVTVLQENYVAALQLLTSMIVTHTERVMDSSDLAVKSGTIVIEGDAMRIDDLNEYCGRIINHFGGRVEIKQWRQAELFDIAVYLPSIKPL